MYYLYKSKCKPGAALPYHLKEGDDRLSYISPTEGVYEKTVDMINRGLLPRYLGPYDYCRDMGEYTEATTAFPTLEAAEEMKSWVMNQKIGRAHV